MSGPPLSAPASSLPHPRGLRWETKRLGEGLPIPLWARATRPFSAHDRRRFSPWSHASALGKPRPGGAPPRPPPPEPQGEGKLPPTDAPEATGSGFLRGGVRGGTGASCRGARPTLQGVGADAANTEQSPGAGRSELLGGLVQVPAAPAALPRQLLPAGTEDAGMREGAVRPWSVPSAGPAGEPGSARSPCAHPPLLPHTCPSRPVRILGLAQSPPPGAAAAGSPPAGGLDLRQPLRWSGCWLRGTLLI